VQKYEKGANAISFHRLLQFCARTGVPIEIFLGEAGRASEIDQMNTSRETLELVRNYGAIESGLVKSRLHALIRSIGGAVEAEAAEQCQPGGAPGLPALAPGANR
jgi:hypothetical protein